MHSRTSNYSSKPSARVTPRTVTLLDPVFRTGLLEIPVDKTLPTKGRDEWLEGRLNKDLSLCCLFQKGRCHAQDRCFQVHVDRDFMTALRDQQSRIVSCCRNCHDTASLSSQAMNFFSAHIPSATNVSVVYQNGATRTIDCDSLAYSAGLIQQFEEHGARVENGLLTVPARRICRLHLRGCCKYGKDCKNVHACSKLGEKFLEAPVLAVVAPIMVKAPMVAATIPAPIVKASPPMTSFAPVATVVPKASNPLGFGIADRNAKSVSLKSLDVLDFCEGSRMMKSFLFDANVALEDSSKTSGSSELSMGDSIDAASLAMAFSPGQKRRAPHALHLDAMHPCSQQASDYLNTCRVSQWDSWSFTTMLA